MSPPVKLSSSLLISVTYIIYLYIYAYMHILTYICLYNTTDLHTFWLDADLILCAYELSIGDRDSRSALTQQHRQEDITYCFRLLLRHASNHRNLRHDTGADKGKQTGTGAGAGAGSNGSSNSSSSSSSTSACLPPSQEATNLRVMRDLAECRGLEVLPPPAKGSAGAGAEEEEEGEGEGEEGDDEEEDDSELPVGGTSSPAPPSPSPPSPARAPRPPRRASDTRGSEAWQGFAFVPVIFEVDDFRKKKSGSRRIYYGIQFPSAFEIAEDGVKLRIGDRLALHSFMECTKSLCALLPVSVGALDKPLCYARLDEASQRRLQLSALFACVHEDAADGCLSPSLRRKLLELCSGHLATDELLAVDKNKSAEYGVSSRRHREGIGATLCHSRVLVQLGRFYWAEEYLLLTASELVFVKPASRLGRTVRVRLPIKDILGVSLIPAGQELFPAPGAEFSFLVVSTFSREYHLGVRGHAVRDRWLASFAASRPLAQPTTSTTTAGASAGANATGGGTASGGDARQMSVTGTASPNKSFTLPLPLPRDRSDSFSLGSELGREVEVPLYLQDMNMLSAPAGFSLGDRIVLNGRRFQANPFDIDASNDSILGQLVSPGAGIAAGAWTGTGAGSAGAWTGTGSGAGAGAGAGAGTSSPERSDRPEGGRRERSSSGLFSGAPLPPPHMPPVSAPVSVPFIRDHRYVLDMRLISSIVAEALDLILNICERMGVRENTDVLLADPVESQCTWLLFMDKISALSNIDIDYSTYDPGSNAAIAMFLNLYHTMLLHSFLAVRTPSSALNWPSLFNCCAYEAFGDIFSLSELEHGVIRNGKFLGVAFLVLYCYDSYYI
jgi:hypothetical protein